jgi:AraC-like DNA-binding protein
MLENLKLDSIYEGFLFLAQSVKNPPTLRPHHHVELELNLVAEGEITYIVGGQRFTFRKRTLLWMFPSQEHQLVDRTADAQYYVAVFKPDLIQRACRGKRYAGLKRNQLSNETVLHTELSPPDFEQLRRAMDATMADGIDSSLLNREAGFGLSPDFSFRHNDPDWLNAGLRHLLLASWRLQQGRSGTNREVSLHPAVRKALDWIEREIEMEGAPMLQYCGVSEAYLSRIFHQQVGVPLSRYRNSVRLSRFWEALREQKDRTLLDAAYSAGFGSYAQFYRVFSEAYQQGPRDLLRQQIPSRSNRA